MNPYLSIWTKPASTIRSVLKHEVRFTPAVPLCIASLSAALGVLLYAYSTLWVILYVAIATIFFYLLNAYLMPEIITKFGKLWHGLASFRNMQKVFALACIPVSLILVLQFAQFGLAELKYASTINYSLQVIMWLFCIHILVVGISIAQGFSYTVSVLNLVISSLPFLLIRLALVVH